MPYKYCESLLYRKRLKTIEVNVGNVKIGGDNPIVVQSMLNVPTTNIQACVNQTIELHQAGCQLVRLAVPNLESVRNLEEIKNNLLQRNCNVPLVADVHFQSNIAIECAKYVEKVRINPGNFCEITHYNKTNPIEKIKNEPLKHIEETFSKLIEIAETRKIAIRIGVNHGSLSNRILSLYGNTVNGMVESAIEYLQIAKKLNFHNIVISMKASNPKTMIEAYRMLVNRMYSFGTLYPLHIGVTEAGFGVTGRVKSSVGIGSLLVDGLGDTIRVSLTENPVNEIPVAKELANLYNQNQIEETITKNTNIIILSQKPTRVLSKVIRINDIEIGGDNAVIVERVSHIANNNKDTYNQKHRPIELVSIDIDSISSLKNYLEDYYKFNIQIEHIDDIALLSNAIELVKNRNKIIQINFVCNNNWMETVEKCLSTINNNNIIIGLISNDIVHNYRILYTFLLNKGFNNPVNIIVDSLNKNTVDVLKASSELGSLFNDGFGNIVSIRNYDDIIYAINIIYDILQACNIRITSAEIVSCPSCGRTQYNIEKTATLIKSKLSHLKGLKIAVMGCIVNGVGEMGNADFGYIGGKKGKVNLYMKKTCVKKNIDEKDALNELISIIKQAGKWEEPY